MKIRIAPESLRIRIKPAELATLHATGALHQELAMGPGPEHVLHFKLLSDPGVAPISVSFEAGIIRIRVSSELITELLDTPRVGTTVTQAIQSGRSITVIFEKDFKCLTHRAEDIDAFPNPAAQPDT